MRRTPIALIQGASRGIGLAFVERLLREGRADRVFATARDPETSPGLVALKERHGDALALVALDPTRPDSIAAAAERVGEQTERLHLLINCAGVLHVDSEFGPEKRLEQIDLDVLRRVFDVNAFGPLLVARAFRPLLGHDERSVLASLSARVGSIGDNRLGGWYAYRASKAAQNMFTRNLSIELGRRAPRCVCVALHPGTVDTDLSRPFQRGVPPERLFTPEFAAGRLLEVIDGLNTEDSGHFFAWDGSPIPW